MRRGLINSSPKYRALLVSLLKLLIIFGNPSSISSLEESLCAGTGYFLPGRNLSGKELLGHRSTGWERFFDQEVNWASVFWVADHRKPPEIGSADFVHVRIRMIADQTGSTMVGWLALEIFRLAPFQFLVIWAITQRNEAHGQFLFEENLSLDQCFPLLRDGHSYVNCSAVPLKSEIVPNLVISGNLNVTTDDTGNVLWAKIPSSLKQNRFTVLWHASPTHCFNQKAFRFMIAATSAYPWNAIVNWTREPPFKSINEALDYGPIIFATPWLKPSRYAITSYREPGMALVCTDELFPDNNIPAERWVSDIKNEKLEEKWFATRWMANDAEDKEVLKKRATCKGASDGITEFVGRCPQQVDPKQPSFIYAKESVKMECPKKKARTKRQTQVTYNEYVRELKLRLQADCECPIPGPRRKRRSTEDESESDYEDDDMVNEEASEEVTTYEGGAIGREFLEVEDSTISEESESTTQKPVHFRCSQVGISEEDQILAGMCVFSEPGKLVFGVRQWHGLTSLVTALIINPISILIARYHKGYYMMRNGKLPLRTWYLIHILLIFPCIWMHASGFAALSRQTQVLGYSLTPAAKIHRALGIISLSLMGVQIMTGFLRPQRVGLRRLAIFIHWGGGYAQHIMELFLCLFSNQIPGSPTNSHTVLNKNRFSKPIDSVSTDLFIAWIAFSGTVHLLQTLWIKIQDVRMSMGGRSIFPIIIPMLTVSQAESEKMQKQAWVERAVLIIYSLVSGIIFFVVSVSMYQIFYDKSYYGFGPMSCSHKSKTELRTESGC